MSAERKSYGGGAPEASSPRGLGGHLAEGAPARRARGFSGRYLDQVGRQRRDGLGALPVFVALVGFLLGAWIAYELLLAGPGGGEQAGDGIGFRPPPGLQGEAMPTGDARVARFLRADPEAPWRRYAQPAVEHRGKPVLAVVIDDLGHNPKAAERLLGIEAALTFSILPDGPHAAELARQAREAGREVLLHLPMQPLGDEDPGPDAIQPGVSRLENEARLARHLAAFDGFVGVNNHMGSAATADLAAMETVMRVLSREGYLFLDSRTAPRSIALAMALGFDMPAAGRSRFLDHLSPGRAAVLANLEAAEADAIEKGVAIAIGHPGAATLDALEEWAVLRSDEEVVLVPISAAVLRAVDLGAPVE